VDHHSIAGIKDETSARFLELVDVGFNLVTRYERGSWLLRVYQYHLPKSSFILSYQVFLLVWLDLQLDKSEFGEHEREVIPLVPKAQNFREYIVRISYSVPGIYINDP
jgi:hypothetical protein